MLKHIIFDLDGTLIDTLADIADAMNQTLARFGFETQLLEAYQKLIGGGSKNMVGKLVPENIEQDVYQHYLKTYEANLIKHTRPYPGITEALHQLQNAGVGLAVVTNKHAQQATALLQHLFKDIHFTSVQGVVPGLPKKPNPTTTLAALKQLGARPEEALFVGDTLTDMQTAKAAGVPSVFVTWGYGDAKALNGCQPQHTISQISDLHYLVSVMPKTSQQSIDNHIVDLIQQYLVVDKNDQFDNKGRAYLLGRVQHFTAKQEKLQLILPGFPCKSPNNIDKSFSAAPDYGEVMAIERLDDLCTQLNKIYTPGSELTILSDGTTFSDIVHVSEEAKEHYKNSLRNITTTKNIAWADLSTMLPPENGKATTSENKRKELLKSIAKGPRSFENFIKRVKSSPAETAAHDRMCSYLYHDMNLEHFSEGNRDKYLESISEKAYQMMYRGKALDTCIKRAFPCYIRLSVHQYDNSGPKFTFNFSSNHHKAIAPWHSVPVRLLNGEFIQLPHSIAKERLLAKVTYQQQNWFYLEVEKPELAELHYEVVKGPKFGLQISNPDQVRVKKEQFSAPFLQKLGEEFGFIGTN